MLLWIHGFPNSSVGKESAYKAGDHGSIPGSGRSPGEGIGSSILELPLWLSLWRIFLQCWRPGFHSWVGKIPWRRERLFWPRDFHGLYSSWGHKEPNTTEWLSLSLSGYVLTNLQTSLERINLILGHVTTQNLTPNKLKFVMFNRQS